MCVVISTITRSIGNVNIGDTEFLLLCGIHTFIFDVLHPIVLHFNN
jgi:hypothetical protein